jgi:hypothetical protein
MPEMSDPNVLLIDVFTFRSFSMRFKLTTGKSLPSSSPAMSSFIHNAGDTQSGEANPRKNHLQLGHWCLHSVPFVCKRAKIAAFASDVKTDGRAFKKVRFCLDSNIVYMQDRSEANLKQAWYSEEEELAFRLDARLTIEQYRKDKWHASIDEVCLSMRGLEHCSSEADAKHRAGRARSIRGSILRANKNTEAMAKLSARLSSDDVASAKASAALDSYCANPMYGGSLVHLMDLLLNSSSVDFSRLPYRDAWLEIGNYSLFSSRKLPRAKSVECTRSPC